VPVVLSPVTLDNRGGTCGYRPPAWFTEAVQRPEPLASGNRAELRFRRMARLMDSRERPYIHLVDGGLSDKRSFGEAIDSSRTP
jgi:NTE family protein